MNPPSKIDQNRKIPLLSLSKLIGRVQFSLSTAFWCSLIGHSFLSIIDLFTGFVFANHMEIGLLISLAVAFAFQTVFFQIAVPCKEWNSYSMANRCAFPNRDFLATSW